MNYKLETSITEIIKQIKVEFPYNDTMCRDKYNESVQDYLYEVITSNYNNNNNYELSNYVYNSGINNYGKHY